ncbi:hypothetical protein JN12_02454 [Geobacter argillaceus]|uniref:Uncharacterized protein n=1 Tax=Geobacter argillaceus TaxID=345631 RepID=A0A562VM61_9BACT|nr:hypothetical protein JN12_02454 [Geobacter argillaceus]
MQLNYTSLFAIKIIKLNSTEFLAFNMYVYPESCLTRGLFWDHTPFNFTNFFLCR